MEIRMAIIDRSTSQPICLSSPLPLSEWPFTVPDDAVLLWKYGDYWKFESLFRNRKLYFRRADHLPDTHEGRFAPANRERRSLLFREAFTELNLGCIDKIIRIQEMWRQFTFLSCWHKSDCESARMWHEYTTSAESVVLRTTVGGLLRAVDPRCKAFNVIYEKDSVAIPELHSLAPYVFKRIDDFEFENEFRLCLVSRDGEVTNADWGIYVDASSLDFVTEIRLHPSATDAFRSRVADDLSRLGVKIDLRESQNT